jgi:TolB-like protein/Flp pilus assembly protein TadD
VDAVAGVGGMGVVYLAWDERLDRKVALKLLPESMVANEAQLTRLKREARTASALNHPNIVTIHDIGEVGSIHYVAAEFIEGTTLRERMTKGPIPPNESVDIAAQVASALCVAHRAGIVHRDIKPENIMLRPDGYVKVLDFGIAKLTQQETLGRATLLGAQLPTQHSMMLGTTRYMSPEQAMAQQVDGRSDLWSLGVVLYEMLAGRAPFEGETATDVIAAISENDPQPLKQRAPIVPPALQSVVNRSLRKDPAERYQTAEEMLSDLRAIKEKTDRIAAQSARWIAVATVAAILVGVALFYAWRSGRPAPARAPRPSEKSVAVLPFENLSKGEENAFFAGGVQDEILTDLAKIADLKVISRTSVMQYKSGLERNLREIAKALGVSYVIEGSVQRAGRRVRVSAQLIDARNDAHIWAEHYDRDVSDVFAVQTEIAQQIADQLKANLSPGEKAAIAERPTADPVAYAYYIKARELDHSVNWEGDEKSLNQKVELLKKATQRDPNFTLAYCALAKTHVDISDMTGGPEHHQHLELAKNAAETAVRLHPDLGEAHLELARYYFEAGVFTDNYDRARDELAIVRRKLPNNAEALRIEGMIGRHENRWDASLADFQKASELDPRNIDIASYLGLIYFEMRRYSELEQFLAKAGESGTLDNLLVKHLVAMMKLAQGDPVAAQSLLEQVPLDYSPGPWIWDTRFKAALYLRDYDEANRVIAATPAKWVEIAFGIETSGWAEAQIARARGDKEKALGAFAAARKKLQAKFADKPNDAPYLSDVAIVDAGLGRKEEAIREARRAVELQPIAKDAVNGPNWVANLALIYAWTGERDRALEQLEKVAALPGLAPTYGDLRFNPCWDDLRGDPRFDKIVAAAKAASR